MNANAKTIDVELEDMTVQQLEQRASREHSSADDVVRELLSETRNTLTLADFVDRLNEDVEPVQIALYDVGMPYLLFIVHAFPDGSVEDALEDVDAIEVADEQYGFDFEVDPYGTQDLGRISLYTTCELREVEAAPPAEAEEKLKGPISAAEGIENAKNWIQNQESLKPL